jgi:hypothetical protein
MDWFLMRESEAASWLLGEVAREIQEWREEETS